MRREHCLLLAALLVAARAGAWELEVSLAGAAGSERRLQPPFGYTDARFEERAYQACGRDAETDEPLCFGPSIFFSHVSFERQFRFSGGFASLELRRFVSDRAAIGVGASLVGGFETDRLLRDVFVAPAGANPPLPLELEPFAFGENRSLFSGEDQAVLSERSFETAAYLHAGTRLDWSFAGRAAGLYHPGDWGLFADLGGGVLVSLPRGDPGSAPALHAALGVRWARGYDRTLTLAVFHVSALTRSDTLSGRFSWSGVRLGMTFGKR